MSVRQHDELAVQLSGTIGSCCWPSTETTIPAFSTRIIIIKWPNEHTENQKEKENNSSQHSCDSLTRNIGHVRHVDIGRHSSSFISRCCLLGALNHIERPLFVSLMSIRRPSRRPLFFVYYYRKLSYIHTVFLF